jgi:LemA protein
MNLYGYAGLGVAVLILGWAIYVYNRFVHHRAQIREAWGNIDVQLKRRHDLIPNLVDIVQAYADHESSVLREVTKKRSESRQASDTLQTAREESSLSDQLAGLLALAEDYPELKADKNFRDLQATLVDVEDDLQYARRYYNGSVRDYNIRCESFPSLIVARLTGFQREDFFKLNLATEREVPDVELE